MLLIAVGGTAIPAVITPRQCLCRADGGVIDWLRWLGEFGRLKEQQEEGEGQRAKVGRCDSGSGVGKAKVAKIVGKKRYTCR